VRVFLRQPLAESLAGLVRQFIGRLPYTVEIRDHDQPPVELPNLPFDFSDERFTHSFVEIPTAFGYASRDLAFNGRFGFDLRGRIRCFLLKAGDRRHLRLRDTERYSFVGFSPQGDTLVNVKRMTEEIQQVLLERLAKVRHLQPNFPAVIRADLEGILRHFERVLDLLSHRHESEEVKALAEALTAQQNALSAAASFRSHPAAVAVRKQLAASLKDVDSFVTGQFRLSQPAGVLTQDGIPLIGVNLPRLLQLGIGFLYNLDLCGAHRLSLNAARDDILPDAKLENLLQFLHGEIGGFLGEWFREEKIPDEDLQSYLAAVPPRLAEAVRSAFRGPSARRA
jgi:hypothetical protein